MIFIVFSLHSHRILIAFSSHSHRILIAFSSHEIHLSVIALHEVSDILFYVFAHGQSSIDGAGTDMRTHYHIIEL